MIDFDMEDEDGVIRSERHLFYAPRTALHFVQDLNEMPVCRNIAIWRRRLCQWENRITTKTFRNWQSISIHRLKTEALDSKAEAEWENPQSGRTTHAHDSN